MARIGTHGGTPLKTTTLQNKLGRLRATRNGFQPMALRDEGTVRTRAAHGAAARQNARKFKGLDGATRARRAAASPKYRAEDDATPAHPSVVSETNS